jgi:methyltransferase
VTTAPLVWVIALIIVSRFIEMAIGKINVRRLKAEGWREVGARHYPLFIVLHASLLAALALTTPLHRQPVWGLIAVLGLLQIARYWTIASLGPQWTTRVVTRDDAPLTAKGPYRALRHPVYAVVTVEVAVLPLAFGAWPVAVAWSGLNALLLRHRIAVEDAALTPRRALA